MSDLDYRKTYMDCSDKVKEEYYVIIQKMFCELIMEKQGKKILDSKQYKEELMKIAQDVLNETVKFSVFNYNNVTKEEQEKRKQTIYAEYIKYLAFEQNKEKAMKFSEFAQVRYGFFNPNDLEEYYNQQIESERKSRK